MVHSFALPTFSDPRWTTGTFPEMRGLESLRLKIGHLIFDIVDAPYSRRDRGNYNLFFKIDYENQKAIDVLRRKLTDSYPRTIGYNLPVSYPDVQYFFSLAAAVANVQNFLDLLGITTPTIDILDQFPVMYAEKKDSEASILFATENGFTPVFVNGQTNGLEAEIATMAFIKHTEDFTLAISSVSIPMQNNELGDLNAHSTFYSLNVFQPVYGYDKKPIDCNDDFPRYYFSLHSAITEGVHWELVFFGDR
jgi:hypothetical protein